MFVWHKRFTTQPAKRTPLPRIVGQVQGVITLLRVIAAGGWDDASLARSGETSVGGGHVSELVPCRRHAQRGLLGDGVPVCRMWFDLSHGLSIDVVFLHETGVGTA